MHHSDVEPEHVIKALGRIFARTKPVAVGPPIRETWVRSFWPYCLADVNRHQ
jgi:hypothetical protein